MSRQNEIQAGGTLVLKQVKGRTWCQACVFALAHSF